MAPSTSRELEWKLEPPDGFDLGAFAGAEPVERRFTSAYWDTERGTLAWAGLTLRRRTEERSSRWQLKLPAGHARTEVEAAGGTALPSELESLLVAHVGLGGPLREVARLRTDRLVAAVETPRGIVEVAHDRVSVLDGRRIVTRFAELELELKAGDDRALKPLARKIGAERAPTATKLERALGPTPDADADAPLVQGLVRSQLRALLAHDPGVRLGGDPEDVHQLRVALRRTLACLRGGAEWIDPTWADALKPEVDWLLHELAPARDADVFHAWLRAEATGLGADGRALARLDARLDALSTEGHARARAALDDPRYPALLAQLDRPVLLEGEPAFKKVARAETARLKRLARKAGKRPDDELLHRLRLRGKRARYALELAQPELGKRGREALEAARTLQDVLGEHQDAVEAEHRLRELGKTTRGGVALALGRLVEQQRTRRRDAVGRFARAWTRFDEASERALG